MNWLAEIQGELVLGRPHKTLPNYEKYRRTKRYENWLRGPI